MKHILYLVLYIYIPFAYGYGLYLSMDINSNIEEEYRYDIKQYNKMFSALVIAYIFFPITWPFMLIYNAYKYLKTKEDDYDY